MSFTHWTADELSDLLLPGYGSSAASPPGDAAEVVTSGAFLLGQLVRSGFKPVRSVLCLGGTGSITVFSEVSSVQSVPRRDALSVRVALDTFKRSLRLPRAPDPSLDVVVAGHLLE